MHSGNLYRHVQRHKGKESEKAAVAIIFLFGMSIALILVGAVIGFRPNTTAASTTKTPLPQIAPNDWRYVTDFADS